MGSRETWGSRTSFLLACIGAAVGLGNIWRFPYLAFKSGGGAFMIPYIIMLLLCGLPLLFMELSMGQYTRRGPIGAIGKMCPLFQGAGVATVVLTFWLATYYNVIIGWAMFYLGSSFVDPLPWVSCNNTWNSIYCIESVSNTTERQLQINNNVDYCGTVQEAEKNDTIKSTSPSQEFYDRRVLKATEGIENFGGIRWELLGAVFGAWVIVYFCIWKSVKATGKVVYFTATAPYILLFAFLIRAVTLEGATDGILYLLNPKWCKMLDSKVWVYAAAQVFNSIGIAFGLLISFASYNKFHGPILRDTLIVVIVDALTCILCGIIVFATMGNLAFTQGKPIDKVIDDGPGLVFVVFPHALSQMPFPQLWSVIFFLMLILLGVDSQFATVEVMITSLKDGYPGFIENKLKRHEVLVLLVCLVSFIVGIPYIFEGGIYVFQIVDYYAAAISLMFIAFFEIISVVWFYGTGRLSANIKDMTGDYPNKLFRFCWIVISPLLIAAIWIFSIVDYKPVTYNKAIGGEYFYPDWAIAMGWCITATSFVPIPLLAIYNIYKAKADGICNKFVLSLKSTIERCPCGCEVGLDENFEAHTDSRFSLIGECGTEEMKMKNEV